MAVPRDVFSVVDLWIACRRDKALPSAGGSGDQVAALVDAFAALDRMMNDVGA